MRIRLIAVLVAGAMLSGCLGVGHVVKTGYYARKGAEGFVRPVESIRTQPLLPDRYKGFAVLPPKHEIGELANHEPFTKQMEMGQVNIASYLEEGWPVAVEQAASVSAIRNKKNTLAIEVTAIDYNRGGEHIKTGVGEWHVMIARVRLIDAASEKVVGVANIEGRVRVKGVPVHGVAIGIDEWLQENVDAALRQKVEEAHKAAEKD